MYLFNTVIIILEYTDIHIQTTKIQLKSVL